MSVPKIKKSSLDWSYCFLRPDQGIKSTNNDFVKDENKVSSPSLIS